MAETPRAALDFAELYRRLDEAEKVLTREGEQNSERRGEILAARTKALAGERTRQEGGRTAQVLAFRVGGERYAVTIEHLVDAPRQLLGAMVARSRVVPVLDLRQLLGLEGGGMSDLTRVVVVGDDADLLGLAVEEIEGKLELSADGWDRPVAGPFLHVTADRLAILDVAQLGEAGVIKAQ